MKDYVFPPLPRPAVSVRGRSRLYAVRRIFCVGRNYAAHAREMGGNPDREPPFYFAKSLASMIAGGGTMAYPLGTQDLHHEIELVVAMGRPALRVTPEEALDSVWGYAPGLDMTRRDLQAEAKKASRPWTFAKDFDQAAVMGELVPVSEIGHPRKGRIALSVNGQPRQEGDLADMIWSVGEIVSNLSHYYHLQPGDLIMTGTPEGVGPVLSSDRLHGSIEGVGEIELVIGAAV